MELARSRVVLATPTTLIALLRAIEFGWQQTKITKNAKAIQEAGQKIYAKLMNAQAHFTKLGNALTGSVELYNKLLGTIEGKGGVFSFGRELGRLAYSDSEVAYDELGKVERLQAEVRAMESPEWSQPLLTAATGEPGPGQPQG